MKTTFKTKEEYLKVKENWATYFNTEARKLERNEYGNKERKLTATHFALYAILRERDPMLGLSTASIETISIIKDYIILAHNSHNLNDCWFKKWKDFFNLTDKQTRKMFEIAYEIFENRTPFEEIKQEKAKRIPISEEQLMECLA